MILKNIVKFQHASYAFLFLLFIFIFLFSALTNFWKYPIEEAFQIFCNKLIRIT